MALSRRLSKRNFAGAMSSTVHFPFNRYLCSGANQRFHRCFPLVHNRSFSTNTVNQAEIAKFSRIADQWWDLEGDFGLLHGMNKVRSNYIETTLANRRTTDSPPTTTTPPLEAGSLTGLSILDIGCGGGILSESLSNRGAEVLGVDASAKNIGVARAHANKMQEMDDSFKPPTYRCGAAEDLVAEGMRFDVVCALEVVEHVNDPRGFLEMCCALTKEGGTIFVSTMARTLKSYFLTVLAAEYILHWVPRGTHQWSKYLNYEEVAGALESVGGVYAKGGDGMVYNPLTRTWTLEANDFSCNYIMHATKANQQS